MKTVDRIDLVDAADLAKRRSWAEANLSEAGTIPISFLLDGKEVRGIPADWKPTAVTRRLDANLSETVFEGADPKSGLRLRVECTTYQNFPVVEWVAWFSNEGSHDSAILSDIEAIDGTFTGSSPVVYHCNGDYYSADGYTPTETPVSGGGSVQLTPKGGRSCDGAFPYTRIRFAEGGVTVAIGWPGQWSASFDGTNDGVKVVAGQEKTHLRLRPGERIRTPRITLMFWDGDDSRAVNLWRRWYLAHILPRPNGQPIQPHLASCGTTVDEEFTGATEENQKQFIDKFKREGIPFDVWWIDAGWYPCYNKDHVRKWTITGSWIPDPERFPQGLKPVADYVEQNGGELLVWFEPERVRPGTKLDVEHPEWLLRAEGSENALLYLGNPDALQWLSDHVNKMIAENSIKIYRQDFNFAPLAHWRQSEAEDRQGVHENLHVQGYLQYWDNLLAANPGLWIDSCASGGRRNDLETMRRSVPLHYTDYGYGDHPVKLGFQHTLYAWIPYFKEVTLSWDQKGNNRYDYEVDPYGYHCAMAPMVFVGLEAQRSDYDYELAQKLIGMWKRAANTLLFGDYYPLTPFSKSNEAWVVRQFDEPQNDRGLLQGIRLPASADERFVAFPKAIDADARYRFENGESGETKEISGKELIEKGFLLELPARSGVIWFYQRIAA